MPRDFSVYLDDILKSISKIEEYIDDYSFEQFVEDKKTVDAVLRNLEIIGEAVKKVPENVKSLWNNIEWRKISGLRDILIHACFEVDFEIVWDIIQSKLPGLKSKIKEIINTDGD